MRPLTVGSLFSGIGGFEVGFEQAGFETAWQVEMDRDAVSVLERHFPGVRRYRDIRDVDPADLEPVDVVTFGSPCQDLSVAGRRAGMAGERSALFYEATRIVNGLRPRPAFALWENVPGALSSARGRDFGSALDALADAGALDIAWRVLDAQWLGVPQRRRRIFLVADFGGERAVSVLFEPESLCRHLAQGRATREGTAADAEDCAGICGTFSAGAHPGSYNGQDATDGLLIPIAAPLTAGGPPNSNAPGRRREDDENLVVTHALTVANSVQASAGHHGRSSPRGDGSDNLIAFHATQSPVHSHVSPALGASARIGDADLGVATFHEAQITSALNRTRVEAGRPSDTLIGDARVSLIDGRTGLVVRRLTPREAEKLQGFPPDWTRWRADGSEIPDGPRYRMVGNAVATPVVAWIARRLLAALGATEAAS